MREHGFESKRTLWRPWAALAWTAALAAGMPARPAAAQTPCQNDSVLANPEVSNPPSCTAFWNNPADGTTGGPFYPAPAEIRVSIQPSIWNTNCSAACNLVTGPFGPPYPDFKCCNDTPGF